MKKIFFASFLEPDNFGPGRLISLTRGRKPRFLVVKLQWPLGIPSDSILAEYNSQKESDPSGAASRFIAAYKSQLQDSLQDIRIDDLPFENGDTLLSWERASRNNYRKILAEYFQELGYEVIIQ